MKRRRRVQMTLRLKKSHERLFRRVARLADVSFSDTVSVFMAVHVLKERARTKANR